MIDEFPDELLPPVQIKPDGAREALSEIERRRTYIEKLQLVCGSNNIPPMVKLVTDCLDNRPQKRPLAKDMVDCIKSLH